MALLSAYLPIFIGIAVVLLGRRVLRGRSGRLVPLAREAGLLLCAYLLYFAARGLAQPRVPLAYDHALRLIRLEQRLGIFWEPTIQQRALSAGPWLTLANWIYVWLFWPVLAATLVWLFLRHQSSYRLYRNAVLISGAIGLVFFVSFPVAPPRLVDGLSVVDTIADHSVSYQLLFPATLANLYAAMPSLHQGWVFLMGLALLHQARDRAWRVVGLILPGLMLFSIVVTANHYLLDAVAGVLAATAGLVAAGWYQRRVSGTAIDRPLVAARS